MRCVGYLHELLALFFSSIKPRTEEKLFAFLANDGVCTARSGFSNGDDEKNCYLATRGTAFDNTGGMN